MLVNGRYEETRDLKTLKRYHCLKLLCYRKGVRCCLLTALDLLRAKKYSKGYRNYDGFAEPPKNYGIITLQSKTQFVKTQPY
jgi:hypothetical protein